MTARYCNSGDTDDYGYGKTKTPKSDKVKVSIKFDKLKVGDTIKGLEHLGAIVSISGPETTPEKVEDRFTAKKINKIRKWLDKKGFEFDGEYKGQISYWLDSLTFSVVIDPNFILINIDREEESTTFTNWKSAKEYIKQYIKYNKE